jgi:hypothetical protein
MTLSEILEQLRNGARARREGWHQGLICIYIPRSDGFQEPFLRYRQGVETLEQPYPPRRADWYADDWAILTEQDGDDGITAPDPNPPTTMDPAESPQ